MVYSLQLATLRQHECYSGSGEPPSPPLPPPPPGIDRGSPHHRRSLEAGSSTESAEASPQPSCPPPVAVQHRSRRSTPTRHERGRSGPPLALPVMPPAGFSDSREFSEAECDRGGTSARASASGPNIELNTDMDQQLSTMAKSVAVHQHREQFRWLPAGSISPPMGSLGSYSNWSLSGGLHPSKHSALTCGAGPSGVPGAGLQNTSTLYE